MNGIRYECSVPTILLVDILFCSPLSLSRFVNYNDVCCTFLILNRWWWRRRQRRRWRRSAEHLLPIYYCACHRKYYSIHFDLWEFRELFYFPPGSHKYNSSVVSPHPCTQIHECTPLIHAHDSICRFYTQSHIYYGNSCADWGRERIRTHTCIVACAVHTEWLAYKSTAYTYKIPKCSDT